MQISELIRNLQFINKCDAIPGVSKNEVLKDHHSLVQNAVYMAKELLVMPSGVRNLSNIIELTKGGFNVSRLGVCGCCGIYTDKGIIVYG